MPGQVSAPAAASEVHRAIVALKAEITVRFLDLGRYLQVMHSNRLWTHLGHESFAEYLGTPEVSMRRSTAYRTMGIYATYIERLKVSPEAIADIDIAKLDMVRSVLTEENYDEWEGKMRTLSRSDLRRDVAAARLARRGLVLVDPLPEPGDSFAHENATLADLMGDIVQDVEFDGHMLRLVFDSARRLTVTAAGDAVQFQVEEDAREEVSE